MTLSLRINDLARTKPPRLIDSDQEEPYRSEWYRAAKGTFI